MVVLCFVLGGIGGGDIFCNPDQFLYQFYEVYLILWVTSASNKPGRTNSKFSVDNPEI